MGCDIHGVIEVRDGDRWVCVSPVSNQRWNGVWGREAHRPTVWDWCRRDYRVFTLLAGVRSYGDEIAPISEPRGLPDDATDDARACSQGDDYHSHSWVTRAELRAHPMNNVEWLRTLQSALRYPTTDSDETDSDVRLVFWFDN